jgi:hypothetical protein
MIFTNYFCGVQNSLVLKINQEILFSEWGKSKMRKDGTILHGGKNGNKSFSFFLCQKYCAYKKCSTIEQNMQT